MNPFEQLISALAGVPILAGARCRGRHTTFDPQRPDEPDDAAAARHRHAIGLCTGITPDDPGCPALAACTEWLASLPYRRRPTGVIAGRLIREPRQRTAS